MKEKRNCKIVRDLLPNYIENLTNEETNNYIEEHIKGCNDCKVVLENMQKSLDTNSKKKDNREVKYIKKYSKKMKVLKFILLIIIVIFVLIIGRRTAIMFSLSKKAENHINNNYYAKIYSYQGDSLIITESYNKDKDYLTVVTRLNNENEVQKITYYKKGNEKLSWIQVGDKIYTKNSDLEGKITPTTYVSDGLIENLQLAFITGIDSTFCNGKECYVIKGKSYERYIDKETGLAVRIIDKASKNISTEKDAVIDYEYDFNVVEDSDIVKPNE